MKRKKAKTHICDWCWRRRAVTLMLYSKWAGCWECRGEAQCHEITLKRFRKAGEGAKP